MFKSIFRRETAIFGAVMCIVALTGSAAPLFPASIILGLCQFIAVPACAFWFILLGARLYRYGRHLPGKVGDTAGVT
jgi:hypothetical protein